MLNKEKNCKKMIEKLISLALLFPLLETELQIHSSSSEMEWTLWLNEDFWMKTQNLKFIALAV
jgi:hypothetical protein